MYLYVVVANPVEGLLLKVFSLVPCLEVVHECEHYHHRNTTNIARLEQGWGRRGGMSHDVVQSSGTLVYAYTPRAYFNTHGTSGGC